MDWGVLSGLGEGLQAVGGAHMKATLDEKLAAARAAREEELTIAKEKRAAERARNTPDPKLTDFVQQDGVWYEVIKGGEGNELERRLAPENKVREFQQADEDRRRSLENDILTGRKNAADAAMAEKKLANYDDDRSWERGYKERALSLRGSSRRGLDEDDEPTQEEVVNLLIDENKDTYNSIRTRYKDTEAGSATDLDAMARRAVRDAYARGINPNAHLQEVLRSYERRLKQAPKAKAETGTGSFSLSGD